MNREMRRNDRQLNAEDTLSVLEHGEYGVLSTVSREDIPYGCLLYTSPSPRDTR